MSLYMILKGILVGFSVAAPIGPIAILCIRQTVAYGVVSGLISGFAIALADAFYSFVAVLSSTYITQWIEDHNMWFLFLGGMLLLIIGYRIFRLSLTDQSLHVKKQRALGKTFFSMLLLTLASPSTTLLFIAFFGSYGIFALPNFGSFVESLVVGVFIGAMLWWMVLTYTVSTLQKKFRSKIFSYINKVSGVAIMVYGIFTLSKFVYKCGCLL